MDAKKPAKFSMLKRISNFVLAVCVLIIAVNLWLMYTKNAYEWYSLESEQLGRSLAAQAARMLASPMQSGDEESIESYVDTIETDSFVKGTSLYDQHGKTIKSFDDDYSIIEQFRVLNEPPLIFVEDIVHDGKTIGYVKLVLDRDSIIQHHRAFTKSQLIQTALIMFLTAVCAIILTRLFYKVRANYRYSDTLNK
ncbi:MULTISPECIES: AhpA/YtjB family protein [Alteromonadaceae]|uniref:AhpA/YtjB family protein n=1 Tax=Brumicola blandensis TaxID=3075611 RepID=A0AAW8R4F9_9ALTE|nr:MULTISPECIES: AhpA/YtjB family protein [unclassified Alteromonas]MDT0583929.1 AhpA/YtjB family protein [Alteromonas sp. W409]MDT0628842.1 AhpA/YtjB family protein [Alteromonas sp. W364]